MIRAALTSILCLCVLAGCETADSPLVMEPTSAILRPRSEPIEFVGLSVERPVLGEEDFLEVVGPIFGEEARGGTFHEGFELDPGLALRSEADPRTDDQVVVSMHMQPSDGGDARTILRVPASRRGSLAARLANTFLSEVVDHCSYGIDLHTATGHRVNLPHIRANLDDADTDRLARVFGVPVVINTNLLDGSLRRIAADRGVTMLLYEGGEALRFDEWAIRAGLNGILAVMRELGMLPPSRRHRPLAEPAAATGSSWVRAPRGGIVRTRQRLGAHVAAGDVLGVISDTFGTVEQEVRASFPGIIIGKSNLPLANEGDALFHIARFDSLEEVAEQVEAFSQSVGAPAPELDPPPS